MTARTASSSSFRKLGFCNTQSGRKEGRRHGPRPSCEYSVSSRPGPTEFGQVPAAELFCKPHTGFARGPALVAAITFACAGKQPTTTVIPVSKLMDPGLRATAAEIGSLWRLRRPVRLRPTDQDQADPTPPRTRIHRRRTTRRRWCSPELDNAVTLLVEFIKSVAEKTDVRPFSFSG